MSTDSTASALILLIPQLLPPLEGITPHDEFWLQDGTLILVARDIAFRVYRGLLSDQSTVFADMFAASSENADEASDGCPIVRLSDSPEDLTHLFRILLPRSRRRLHPRQNDPKHSFDEVSSLVRLSHKYHIQDVEDQALDLLRQRYTPSFDRWRFGQLDSPLPISISLIHCIGAVSIARLTDTPSLLPTALYSCCRLGPNLLDGWKREDGTVETLSTDDLKRCFAAREGLCKERAKIISQVFDSEPSKGCSNLNQCRPALKEFAVTLVREGLPHQIGSDVLLSFNSNIRHLTTVFPICSACEGELLLRDVKARQDVWDRLPEIFGIPVPGWGEEADPNVTT